MNKYVKKIPNSEVSETLATWIDQWERVKRLGSWIDEIYSPSNTLDQDRASDVVYSFFINCYHLKDWISKYDRNLSPGVERLFSEDGGEIHMQLCADITNRAKHFELDNRRRTDQDAQVTAKSVNVNQGAGVAYRFKLGEYDAKESKNICLCEWDKYIQSNLDAS